MIWPIKEREQRVLRGNLSANQEAATATTRVKLVRMMLIWSCVFGDSIPAPAIMSPQ